MNLHADKDHKSKRFRKKKVYILAKDFDLKRKFEIKASKNLACKRPIFWGHPNSGNCVQNALDYFTKYFLFTKYFFPEKISLFTLLRAEIDGGGP